MRQEASIVKYQQSKRRMGEVQVANPGFPSSEEMLSSQIAASQYAAYRTRLISKRLADASRMTRIWPDFFQPMQWRRKEHNGFKLTPSTGKEFEVINYRNAYFLGQRPTKVKFDCEAVFHKLKDKNENVLTSDLPIERFNQYLAFRHMKGRTLMTGLGMGMAAWMMMEMLPNVESITVVEAEKDLIDLIGPQIPWRPEHRIVHEDAYEYLKEVKRGAFNSVYHDIWYSTGEQTWAMDVVPLYRLSKRAGIGTLGAWGELEMHSQLRTALHTRAHLRLPEEKFKPYRVFRRALYKTFGAEPPYKPQDESQIEHLIELYLTHVGTRKWEETFDWDDE